jgi:hypothetical protein
LFNWDISRSRLLNRSVSGYRLLNRGIGRCRLFNRDIGRCWLLNGSISGCWLINWLFWLSRSLALLVHLEGVDSPESVGKGLRVVADVVIAGWCLGCTRAGRPSVTGPITAEGGIKDDVEVLEDSIDVARVLYPLGRRRTPGAWVRVVSGNAIRDGATREEPNGNRITGPLCSIDTAVVVIEAGAVRLVVLRPDTATSIVSLAFSFHIAVLCLHIAREDAGVLTNGATGTCVEGQGVALLLVYTLKDIDLSLIRPVGTEHPEPACLCQNICVFHHL